MLFLFREAMSEANSVMPADREGQARGIGIENASSRSFTLCGRFEYRGRTTPEPDELPAKPKPVSCAEPVMSRNGPNPNDIQFTAAISNNLTQKSDGLSALSCNARQTTSFSRIFCG
jgi:hypothetical protein